MTTNILHFKNAYLVQFLNTILSTNNRLKRYFLNWLRLNVSKPPSSYKPQPSSHLNKNQIIIKLPNHLINRFYLSFENQRKFEKLVLESFDVIFFEYMFRNHRKEEINTNIYRFMDSYNIDFEHFEALKKKYYRLRNDRKIRT